jgi:uncharacterized damage-inducible protein DinB
MTTRPPAGIEPVALIFKLNNGLVTRSLAGLSDDELWWRPSEGGNPMAWILGHITEVRSGLLASLGRPLETGWGRKFPRGASVGRPADYPGREAVEAVWQATHGLMRDAFSGLTDARLAEPHQGPPLPGVTTLAGAIAFYAFHETYHVGQLGYLRKQMGHSPVAG